MVSDADLSGLARRGDIRAFEALVERYKERAYMVALGFVGSPEDALDLSQDAFVRAFRAMATFRQGAPFYPWFYAILRNTCFNHLRKVRTRAETSLDAAQESGFDVADRSPGPAESAERAELKRIVALELRSLDPAHREIILLRHFEGLSYKEIADVLGCPMGTVMSRLYAARKALGARLAGRLGESQGGVRRNGGENGRAGRGGSR
jgi:RNA polymerase sigma-70 factor (ECF subfamily)